MLNIFTVAFFGHRYVDYIIQIRNREMVDRADLIVCYIEHEKGGAWQTAQYAIKQGKAVINIADEHKNNFKYLKKRRNRLKYI